MSNPPETATIDYTALRQRALKRSRINQTSKYRGISWYKHECKWRVRVIRHGITFMKAFESEEDAARVYDAAIRLLKGSKAPEPNFDGLPPQGLSDEIISGWLKKRGMFNPKPSKPKSPTAPQGEQNAD